MAKEPAASNTNNPTIVSVISYITLIGWIVAYLLNSPKSEQVSYHLRQSLGINLLFIASGVVMIIPLLGWVAGAIGYIAGFVLWIMGLIYAIDGGEKEVPFLGAHFQRWFQGI